MIKKYGDRKGLEELKRWLAMYIRDVLEGHLRETALFPLSYLMAYIEGLDRQPDVLQGVSPNLVDGLGPSLIVHSWVALQWGWLGTLPLWMFVLAGGLLGVGIRYLIYQRALQGKRPTGASAEILAEQQRLAAILLLGDPPASNDPSPALAFPFGDIPTEGALSLVTRYFGYLKRAEVPRVLRALNEAQSNIPDKTPPLRISIDRLFHNLEPQGHETLEHKLSTQALKRRVRVLQL
ncbi:MAG: hypothetical protein HYZ73_06455 [Elusimicrobia bacterium]|nr:hypothetical protein [Elusimicrobiota bacterium]